MARDIAEKEDGVLCKVIFVTVTWTAGCEAQRCVTVACDVLGTSTSGYLLYQRRRRSGRLSEPSNARVGNKALLAHIRPI